MTAATVSPMARVKELITLKMMYKTIHAVPRLGRLSMKLLSAQRTATRLHRAG